MAQVQPRLLLPLPAEQHEPERVLGRIQPRLDLSGNPSLTRLPTRGFAETKRAHAKPQRGLKKTLSLPAGCSGGDHPTLQSVSAICR